MPTPILTQIQTQTLTAIVEQGQAEWPAIDQHEAGLVFASLFTLGLVEPFDPTPDVLYPRGFHVWHVRPTAKGVAQIRGHARRIAV